LGQQQPAPPQQPY
nr:Chain A, LEU-GLY-GLN-GLN-GLN-PRO-ALA-PRO-PRO-GLN-GLN-PRO-TYR [Homo sapiens]